jgi:hypothetical protein
VGILADGKIALQQVHFPFWQEFTCR